jgi:hypothetical protein
LPCCSSAGDKLRSELSSTSVELQQERAQRQQAEAEGEVARLQLGGTKQHMAKTAAELERERETAAAMKDRVNKLNANFMQTSEWQLAKHVAGAACLRAVAGAADSCMAESVCIMKWDNRCWLWPPA